MTTKVDLDLYCVGNLREKNLENENLQIEIIFEEKEIWFDPVSNI